MRLQIPKCFMTYAIVLFYLCTPMLDGTVCADCAGAPLGGGITISHMKTAHVDVNYSKKGQTRSNTDREQGHKSFCSICANSILGIEVYSSQEPILVVQSNETHMEPPLSELHYSIHKPPPNFLV